jgi:hypothetical protein
MIRDSEFVNDLLTCGTTSRRTLLALLAPSHFMLVRASQQREVRSARMAWEEGDSFQSFSPTSQVILFEW